MTQLESWPEILNNADTSEKCLACFKEALGEFLQFTLNEPPKESDYLTFHGHFNTRYYALLKAEEEAKKAALNQATNNT